MATRTHRQVYIDDQLFDLDMKARVFRSVQKPRQRISFDALDYDDYELWYDQLDNCVGHRVVSANLMWHTESEVLGLGRGWYPVLYFSDGTEVVIVADDEGSGPGRVAINCANGR